MRKRIPALLAAAIPLAAAAQTLTATQQAEADVQTAYATLAANQGVRFDINGTQTTYAANGSATSLPLTGELYYQASVNTTTGQQTVKVDLTENLNGTLTFELIADGNNVWSYRPALVPTAYNAGSYAATAYGSTQTATQSANYVHDLMAALTAYAPAGGRSAYAVRLIKELFGNPAAGPVYRSWIPMPPNVGPTEIAFPPSYQDPITGLWANPTTGVEQPSQPTTLPETWWVIYNDAPYRAISFELQSSGGNGPNTINRIYYSDRQSLGTTTRVTQWTITPVVTNDFRLARFAPYSATQMRNWRPVIGPGH